MKLNKLNANRQIITVIEKIKSLFGVYDVICENNEEDYYFKNPKFIEWLNSNGVEVKGVPPSKKGSEGIAYFLDDKVVKISGDEIEASVANKIKGNYDVAAAIDVLPLGNNKWAILQHFASSSNDELVEGLDYLMAFFDNHSKEVILNSTEDIIEQILIEFPDADTADLEGAITLVKRLYEKTGFIHDDAAPSNVGELNGNIVFTDLGPNRIAT